MDKILDIVLKVATSKYYIFLYAYLFIVTIIQAKVVSKLATRETNKILDSILNHRIANEAAIEIKSEIIRESKLGNMYLKYYNYKIKAQVYFLIGISSLIQLIALLLTQTAVDVGMNLSFLTMTISFIEWKDNIGAYTNIKKEIDMENKKLIDDLFELNDMAIEDFVKEHILNQSKND